MVTWLIATFLLLYPCLVLLLWLGWERTGGCASGSARPAVTVIVPVRNEAENIATLLATIRQQEYPAGNLEVIVVDDHSTDGTLELAAAVMQDSDINYQLLKLSAGQRGKKAALQAGVQAATHDFILTTDGDCRPHPGWVAGMSACLAAGNKFVSGAVRLWPPKGLFARLQAIEFASLVGSGAACIGWRVPVMANAASMGFTKAVFKEGATNREATSSGDDVFLLHKVARSHVRHIAFVRQPGVLVDTRPANGFKEFMRQRQRWAAKWRHYFHLPTKALAAFVFLVNLLTILLPALAGAGLISWLAAANLIMVKFVFEYLFLREISRFFGLPFRWYEFVLLAILYPPYVVAAGLAGLSGSFIWKGRKTS